MSNSGSQGSPNTPPEVPRRQSEGSDENGEQEQRQLNSDDPLHQALSRCNIQVNLRHVNTNSHVFSLNNSNNNRPNPDQFQPMRPPLGSGNLNLNLNNYSSPLTLNLSHGRESPKPESSSEDDDSVWYEYGCV